MIDNVIRQQFAYGVTARQCHISQYFDRVGQIDGIVFYITVGGHVMPITKKQVRAMWHAEQHDMQQHGRFMTRPLWIVRERFNVTLSDVQPEME